MDEARLRDERKSRSSMRDRMSGRSGSDDPDADRSRRRAQSTSSARPRPREDDDLAKAIEASKRSAADEERRTRGDQQEDDLAKALRLSQEEEAKRLAELARARGSLFDDQAERNNDLVDLSGPSIQQPMMTGMPQFQSYNPYAQYVRRSGVDRADRAQQQQLLEQQQQEEYMRMMQQQEAQRQVRRSAVRRD